LIKPEIKRMKRKLIITACIFLLIVVEASAQKGFVPVKELTTESNTLNYKLAGKQYYNTIIPSGTVFLYNDWEDGYVQLINGDRYDNLSLKYNIYLDELIEINNRSVTMIMLDKNTISEFGFYNQKNDEPTVFKKMYYPKNPDGDYYFNPLYEGNLKLVVRYRSLEEETGLYKDSYGIMRNTKYSSYQYYYVIFPDNRFEKFKLKRRSFVELFEGKEVKKEIRRILRRNDIFFRNDQQTIKAVQLVEEAFYSNH